MDLIRLRGELAQAARLEAWLERVLEAFRDNILAFSVEAAQVWDRLRAPRPENELDRQIAAIAIVHDLTVVTRNTPDFARTGARPLNPFATGPAGP